MMKSKPEKIPVSIVTGFLGSGKTTLINHVLSGGDLGRVAALVNDFGEINIDAALIASVTKDVIQLSNGCVCCTINGDLFEAAKRVLALTPGVQRIVVETTGLANPLPVGLTFLQTDLRDSTILDSLITVVDCANFALDLFKLDAAMAQIIHGDIIVFNKTDLAEESVLKALESRIHVIKPRARTLRAVMGRVPLSAVFDQGPGGIGLIFAGVPSHRHIQADGFRSYSYRFDQSLSAQRFQGWLDRGIPEGIYRAKGFVRFDSDSTGYVFQLCGTRASFSPMEIPVGDIQLVFIGQEVDADELERQLRATLF